MLLVKRAVAVFLDTILLNFIISLLAGAILGREAGYFFGVLIGAAYQALFLSMNNGQTPAKMLLGIRVVKVGGGSISLIDGVLRYIGYILNTVVFLLGWVLAIVTGRGFHDYMAGTQVIDV